MTHTPTPLDPVNIPPGAPGQPLANGHVVAHNLIRDEIIVNARAIAAGPQGWVASITGPAAPVACGAAVITILALTAQMTAGRRYRMTAQAGGTQSAAAGTAIYVSMADTAGGIPGRLLNAYQLSNAVGQNWANGAVTWVYAPATTGPYTWTMSGMAATGTFTVAANQAQIALEDIGPQ